MPDLSADASSPSISPLEEARAERAPASRFRVTIVGGGISGLSAAYALTSRTTPGRRPIEVTLVEAKERLGGAVWTESRQGFILEAGADSFITNKPWGIDLCRQLGLAERLIGTDPQHRRSFVVRKGRLLPVPEGFVMMAPSRLAPLLISPILSWRGKIRLLLDLVLPRKTDNEDESLSAFVKRRLGREALERLVQPLVGGIYTGDPRELSLQATLPQFLEMEQTHGSLIRHAMREGRAQRRIEAESSGARYGLFVTPTEGMGALSSAVAAALPRGSVRLSTPVRRVSRSKPTGPWLVELLDGPPIESDAVLLATEAHASARLLEAFDPDLARHLRSIPYASSAIVTTGYRRDQIAHPLDGFGVVVPMIEKRSVLAISFTSVKFPSRAPAGTVLLRTFVGGATQPDLFDLDDSALQALVRRELSELIGASGDPLLVEISRHVRAMPQYTLGHLDRVAAIRRSAAAHAGLALAGNAFDGVGIPDCIRSGQEAADRLLAALADPARRAVA
jgi:protoporphyrinogen/coproporphyrinogen III oxidase